VLSYETSSLLNVDVRRPRPKGAARTTATPSSRQVARRLLPVGPSMLRVKTPYSVCTAAMGAILTARRRVVEEMEERPMCLILPSLGGIR